MKLTILSFFIFLSFNINAQITDSICIMAIDNLGNTDTVVFGFAENATDGIDTFLEEKNIFSTSLNDLDIRLIRRDTITKIIEEWDTGNLDTVWINGCHGLIKPFAENVDLKRDFRQNSWLDDHFILEIHGTNFPITIKVVSVYTDYIVPYCVYDENYNAVYQSDIQGLKANITDTILTIENSEQPNIIEFRPWVILDVKEQPKIYEIEAYPNPGSDFIKIQLNQLKDNRILYVSNILGGVLETIVVENKEYVLDISNYPPGIYFIRDNYTTLKFIKI